jgi:D-alanyl-D-alanine carboxypeptidase
MMNERAKEAGATDTHFANANGLYDSNHYVTAYDMAMITRAASQYSLFNEIVNTTSYTVGKNNKRTESATAYQRHKMVWPTSGYYYEGIIGGKTGYTDESGTTLVTYAERDGMTLIAVVLKSNGANVYTDTKTLLDYGFDNFNLVNVSQNDTRFSEEKICSLPSPFSNSTDSIYIDKDANIVIPKKTDFSKVTSAFSFESSDDSFATITYSFAGRSVGTASLKYESNSIENTETENAETKNAETVVSDTQQTTLAANTSSASETESTSSKTDKKSTIKLLKFLIPAFIVIVVIIIIIILITLQRRKLNRIRTMKRQRQR